MSANDVVLENFVVLGAKFETFWCAFADGVVSTFVFDCLNCGDVVGFFNRSVEYFYPVGNKICFLFHNAIIVKIWGGYRIKEECNLV